MTRDLDIRIRAAKERGYIVEEAGEVVAAFSTVDEVADWMKERERHGDDKSGSYTVVETEKFPNVVRERTEPRSLLQRVRGV